MAKIQLEALRRIGLSGVQRLLIAPYKLDSQHNVCPVTDDHPAWTDDVKLASQRKCAWSFAPAAH